TAPHKTTSSACESCHTPDSAKTSARRRIPLASGAAGGRCDAPPAASSTARKTRAAAPIASPPRAADFQARSAPPDAASADAAAIDRKSTRLNSSHVAISYAVFCLKKKKKHSTLHP